MIRLSDDSEKNSQQDIILEVEDEIIATFCELNGGMEFAMPIIRKQFEKMNIDFKNPTIEQIIKIANILVEITEEIQGELVAKKERRIFKEYMHKFKTGD